MTRATQSPSLSDWLRIVAECAKQARGQHGLLLEDDFEIALRTEATRLAAQTATPACEVRHEWDEVGYRCVRCGTFAETPAVSPAPAETGNSPSCGGDILGRGKFDHERTGEPTKRYRHLKRGTDYEIERRSVEVQASRPIVEGDLLVVYIGSNGRAWARLESEFYDGRFVEIPDLAGTSRPNEPERADSGGVADSTQPGKPPSEADQMLDKDRSATPSGASDRIIAGRRTGLSTGDAGANLLTQLSESYGDRGTAGVHAASPVPSPLATPEAAGELRADDIDKLLGDDLGNLEKHLAFCIIAIGDLCGGMLTLGLAQHLPGPYRRAMEASENARALLTRSPLRSETPGERELKPCFWPQCSNRKRCNAFGSCVALTQRRINQLEAWLNDAAAAIGGADLDCVGNAIRTRLQSTGGAEK